MREFNINKSLDMSKNVINFTEDSDIILQRVKLLALKNKMDVSNKEKLVNYALWILGKKL